MILKDDIDHSNLLAPVQPGKESVGSKERRLSNVQKRRLLQITSIMLLLVIIFAAVRLSTVASATDDQLFVQIGNQQPALVDLRLSLPISPSLFGVNVFPEIGTSSQDKPYNGFMSYSSPIVNGLQNAGIKLLRFPGGSWGEDHLLSFDQLNAFSSLLSQVDAEGMIQARLSGPINGKLTALTNVNARANLAGRWVDYMNNPKSDLRTGKYLHAPYYPVEFWTVGNEPDKLINSATGKPYTVAEYVNDFIQFSLSMHQNDPAIEVFGPEISQFYGVGAGPADANGQLWMETFLKGVGTYERNHPELSFHLLDGVSFHRYPLTDASKAPDLLLSSTDEWNYVLPPLRKLIQQDLGRTAPIAVTEINANPTNQVPSQKVAALWWADTLGTLMSQQVEYSAFFSAEGVDTPYPLFTSDGLQQTPMFRVMQVFSHLQQNLVPVETQREPISMYATQDNTHRTVSLLFVNKSTTTQVAHVSSQNHAFNSIDISLFGYSITLVTLHRNGAPAVAYSYMVSTSNGAPTAPLTYTVCGKKMDALANQIPC